MEDENVAEDVASGVPFVVVIVGTSAEGISTGSAALCCVGMAVACWCDVALRAASETELRLSALGREALSLLESECRERENIVNAVRRTRKG